MSESDSGSGSTGAGKKPKKDPTAMGVSVFGDAGGVSDHQSRMTAEERAEKAFADVEAELALEERMKREAEAAAAKAEADRIAMEKYQNELAEYNKKMEEYKLAKAKHDAEMAERAAWEEAEKKRDEELKASKALEDEARAAAEKAAAEAAAAAEKAAHDAAAAADADRAKAEDDAKRARDEEEAAAKRMEEEAAAVARAAAESMASGAGGAADAFSDAFQAEAALARQRNAMEEALASEERLKLEAAELARVTKEMEEKRLRDEELAALNDAQRRETVAKAREEADAIAAARQKEERSAGDALRRQIEEAQQAADARKKAEAAAAADAAAAEAKKAEDAKREAEARAKAEEERIADAARAAAEKAANDAAAAVAAEQAQAQAAQDAQYAAQAAAQARADAEAKERADSEARAQAERDRIASLAKSAYVEPAPRRYSEAKSSIPSAPVSGVVEPPHPALRALGVTLNALDPLYHALDENLHLRHELARLQKLEAAVASGHVSPLDAANNDQAAAAAADKDQCRRVFEEFDTDKSGFIDTKELSLLAATLGQPLDESELESAAKTIDLNGDGKITFDEFWVWWTAQNASGHVAAERAPLKLALLKAKLFSRQATKAVESSAAAAAAGAGSAGRRVGDFKYGDVATGLAAREDTLRRDDSLVRLTLTAGTPPPAGRAAATVGWRTLGLADCPAEVQQLQAAPANAKGPAPNSFMWFDVRPKRAGATAEDIRDAVADLYEVAFAPDSAKGDAAGAGTGMTVTGNADGTVRVSLARYDADKPAVHAASAAAVDKQLSPISSNAVVAKWERSFGWLDLWDATKRGLRVGDVAGNFRATVDVRQTWLRVAATLLEQSAELLPAGPLRTSRLREAGVMEYARWGATVTVDVSVGDYTAESRQLLTAYNAKGVHDGVDLDILRLFSAPVSERMSAFAFSLAEVQRNATRTDVTDEWSRRKIVLKGLARDIEEVVAVSTFFPGSGQGYAYGLNLRMTDAAEFAGNVASAVAAPPPVPAGWVQTVMRGKYPQTSSADDDVLRQKLAAGFVPATVVGFVKPMASGAGAGVAVLGFQVIYKTVGVGGGQAHVGRLQGQVDASNKDVKSIRLDLADGEAVTKIGLTLASPKNKYLSVTLHTSGGQVWTLGGSAGPYHYVLGNGVNTAFVALTGDFGGPLGALRNLAYWCVGV